MFSNFFPSLAHPRIAILGLAGRSKRSMDGLSSFVDHGLHMVPWTWPPGCQVDRSNGSGRPKGRLQSRRVLAQDELESCASDACERLMYQNAVRGRYDELLMDRIRSYMHISTPRSMVKANRLRTGLHLSPPQALMVETSRLVCNKYPFYLPKLEAFCGSRPV